MQQRALIPPEIIECIKEARDPSLQELGKVADHIWSDIGGSGRQRRNDLSEARLLSFRAALTALVGASNPTL